MRIRLSRSAIATGIAQRGPVTHTPSEAEAVDILRQRMRHHQRKISLRRPLIPLEFGQPTIAPSARALGLPKNPPTPLPRAIGFLKVGQEARLQVDAFPFQRFGFLKGYISVIHPTVIRPGDAAFPIEQTEPAYEVEVFIAREYMDAYGERRELRPGMALRADIPIDRRRLWHQLFDPLLAAGKRSGS